jgi:hypothetical protein
MKIPLTLSQAFIASAGSAAQIQDDQQLFEQGRLLFGECLKVSISRNNVNYK